MEGFISAAIYVELLNKHIAVNGNKMAIQKTTANIRALLNHLVLIPYM